MTMRTRELDAMIADLVARAHNLISTGTLVALDDSDPPYDQILEELGELDATSGDGLRPGRYLEFIDDGHSAIYIVDRVGAEQVHTIWLPNPDGHQAADVEPNGYTRRPIAEQNLKQREARESVLGTLRD